MVKTPKNEEICIKFTTADNSNFTNNVQMLIVSLSYLITTVSWLFLTCLTIWQHPHLHVCTFTAEFLWDSWNFEACFVYTGHCHCTFGWKTFWSSSIFRFIKMSFNMIFFPTSGYFSWVPFYLVRNIKPSNNQLCFSKIFPTNFSQFLLLKKKTNFLLVQNRFFFSHFWTNRKLVFFFNC